MAELAAPGQYPALASPEAAVSRPSLTQHWLDRALPIAVIFIVLIAAWYAFSAYFNLQYLNSFHQDVGHAAWVRMSLGGKLHEALTTSQAVMPTPVQTIGDFFSRMTQPATDGTGLQVDLLWTGRAAVLGFLLGALIGVVLALLFMSSRILAQSLMPYVVASQTIPIVALVPALMVTLGLGLRSEVIISAYLAFFSVTISTYKGLLSVEPLAFELMRSYAASPRQVFLKLRLPAALPFLFTGLKIGVTASLIGAVIAELPSGSSHGLGQGLVAASTYSQNIQLWSTMMAASVLGLILYGCVVLAETVLVRWRVEETT